jgi:hypothetical protein
MKTMIYQIHHVSRIQISMYNFVYPEKYLWQKEKMIQDNLQMETMQY